MGKKGEAELLTTVHFLQRPTKAGHYFRATKRAVCKATALEGTVEDPHTVYPSELQELAMPPALLGALRAKATKAALSLRAALLQFSVYLLQDKSMHVWSAHTLNIK